MVVLLDTLALTIRVRAPRGRDLPRARGRHLCRGYQKELRTAKEMAIEEMSAEARTLGADAVVGVDLDYEHIGGGSKSMLMVTASGTAVNLE